MLNLSRYKKRPLRFLETIQHDEWEIKIYTISAKNEYPSKGLVNTAKRNLTQWLSKSNAFDLPVYHMAVLIVHEAKEANYVLINWWIGENMLQHYVYRSPKDAPGEFIRVSDDGLMACVWELEVINFERKAWIEHVLKKPDSPDFEGYLNEHLNTEV